MKTELQEVHRPPCRLARSFPANIPAQRHGSISDMHEHPANLPPAATSRRSPRGNGGLVTPVLRLCVSDALTTWNREATASLTAPRWPERIWAQRAICLKASCDSKLTQPEEPALPGEGTKTHKSNSLSV